MSPCLKQVMRPIQLKSLQPFQSTTEGELTIPVFMFGSLLPPTLSVNFSEKDGLIMYPVLAVACAAQPFL